MSSPNPASRVAVVTGAGRGIGAAIASKLHADGFHVAIVDLDADAARQVATELGEGAEARILDVADRTAVRRLFADLDQRHGRIDVVVNNAMILRHALIPEITEELIDLTFGVGVKGAYWTMQSAHPIMARNGGGAIVNVSSPAATRAGPGASAYAAVKGAISSLTWQASRELGPDGIRVNGIIPGAVPTAGARQLVDDDGYERRRLMSPLLRLGTAEEIANGVAFLVSPEASFVTGHLLAVDGGV